LVGRAFATGEAKGSDGENGDEEEEEPEDEEGDAKAESV
jgi:hypothetical protein